MAFAIIQTGGKQYLVSPNDKIRVEKLPAKEDGEVVFDQVLLSATDGGTKIGKPFVSGSRVTGKVLRDGRAKKIKIFKYKSKIRYRRRKGHRQEFTLLEITAIE